MVNVKQLVMDGNVISGHYVKYQIETEKFLRLILYYLFDRNIGFNYDNVFKMDRFFLIQQNFIFLLLLNVFDKAK